MQHVPFQLWTWVAQFEWNDKSKLIGGLVQFVSSKSLNNRVNTDRYCLLLTETNIKMAYSGYKAY